MSSHSFSFTPFLHTEDVYDSVNDFNPSGISEDTFNLLADNIQSFVLNEKKSLNKFFENDYEEAENIELLYSVTPNMIFANWKKLDE